MIRGQARILMVTKPASSVKEVTVVGYKFVSSLFLEVPIKAFVRCVVKNTLYPLWPLPLLANHQVYSYT
jgi:hypothetical protein